MKQPLEIPKNGTRQANETALLGVHGAWLDTTEAMNREIDFSRAQMRSA